MAAQLRKSFLVDVQEKLLDCRNRNVIVGEERVCPVCHKRLGTSVILRLARYAIYIPPPMPHDYANGLINHSGLVVHYGCAQKEL